jgi:hypothetical protein
MLIIVSRYNENIEWTKQFNNVLIINKGEKINDIDNQIFYPNVGREGHSIYKYIVDNYDNLDDYYIFLQGNPFDHEKNIINKLQKIMNDYNSNNKIEFEFLCDLVLHSTVNNEKNLYYQCANIFETIYKIFGTKIHPNTICIFGAGAQFIVSKESILSRTKNFYENIVKILEYDICPLEGYDVERLHYYIFNCTPGYN